VIHGRSHFQSAAPTGQATRTHDTVSAKSKSMNNVTSQICPHFGICGGCTNQAQPYVDQLAYKQTYLKNLLAQFHPAEFHDIVPSPQIWHFRNKMEFAVTGTVEAPRVGLRPKEKFSEVIDIKECRIFYPQVNMVLDVVRKWITEFRVQPYDLRRQTGKLRYISMRHSKAYDKVMVVLVVAMTAQQFELEREAFGRIVKQLSVIEQVGSVYACLNTGASDEALGGTMILLHGTPCIGEKINGIEYQISPKSFFQTNPSCCQLLYKIIGEQAACSGGTVLDLFCGGGGISLQVAGRVAKVTGVDIVVQNIDDARQNSLGNGVSNATFIALDAQEFLAQIAASGSWEQYSTLIVDPPRQGLTKKDRKFIVDSGIKQLVYVSCNPWNLVQDFKTLLPAYTFQSVQPVDMFPHTPHMEAVVRLIRQ
jgi:23S rRNA (uracil1939-C5)-methyltransferase